MVHAAVKVPRFQAAEDDLSACDSVFSMDKNVNDLLEKELKDINENEKDVCANGHDIRLCNPSYNNYSMDYYQSLWGDITCVKVNCQNKGRTFGELMKKNIRVHVCKMCEIYDGVSKCSYMMCDHCKVMEDDSGGGQRRSKRRRS